MISTRIKEHACGTLEIHRVQDVEPILDWNKRQQADGDGYTPSRDLKKVASIPLVIAEKWRNELGVDVFNPDHKAAARRLLNSNEYLWLRTSGGTI